MPFFKQISVAESLVQGRHVIVQPLKGDMLTVAIYLEENSDLLKNKVKTSIFYYKGTWKNLQ